jgi:hypothetical protein
MVSLGTYGVLFPSTIISLTLIHRVGPVDLTQGTVTGAGPVPTVLDNLYSQGRISSEVLSISYVPTTTIDAPNGELTFGAVDHTKYVSFPA